MNNELEREWKEGVVAQFNVLAWSDRGKSRKLIILK
jgi:hypothetical protein